VPSSPIDVLVRHREDVVLPCPAMELPGLPGLAEMLDRLPDPRRPQGRRYRLGPLLAVCLVAVLSGATSLAAITRFTAGCDGRTVRRLGLPQTAPAATTLGRLLARIDGDALDDMVGASLSLLGSPPRPRSWNPTCPGSPGGGRQNGAWQPP